MTAQQQPSTLTSAELAHFTGTEEFYRHALLKRFFYTDGVKHVADKGQAYWLIDAIASHQINPKVMRDGMLQDFQIWKLLVILEKSKATLTCYRDSNRHEDEQPVVTQEIGYTDFPLRTIIFYVERADGAFIMMLPSER